MVNRVVATKLTEEEHSKLLDTCNREGCTPSSLIRDAILKRFNSEEKTNQTVEEKEFTVEDLKRALGIKSQDELKTMNDEELKRFLTQIREN